MYMRCGQCETASCSQLRLWICSFGFAHAICALRIKRATYGHRHLLGRNVKAYVICVYNLRRNTPSTFISLLSTTHTRSQADAQSKPSYTLSSPSLFSSQYSRDAMSSTCNASLRSFHSYVTRSSHGSDASHFPFLNVSKFASECHC
jgi:hypothetical protein